MSRANKPAQSPDPSERRVDSDGVVRIGAPRGGSGSRLILGAVAVLVACLGLSAWLSFSSGPEAPAPPPSAPRATLPPSARAQAPAPQPAARPVARPVTQPVATPVTGVSEPVEIVTEEAMSPPDEPQDGEKSGLALFVPGTKPIKKGLVVPEDFELPPGYVRHYQTTDEGQMLPAILMFHPDHQPVDANGQPIPLPDDRVVTPELAPAGLPIQRLEVPNEAESR